MVTNRLPKDASIFLQLLLSLVCSQFLVLRFLNSQQSDLRLKVCNMRNPGSLLGMPLLSASDKLLSKEQRVSRLPLTSPRIWESVLDLEEGAASSRLFSTPAKSMRNYSFAV